MEIIRHLYLEVPWSQKALETINKRDLNLADKALEGTISDDEHEIVLIRVRKLISVRIQKIELENFVDLWTGEGITPETMSDFLSKSPEGGPDIKRVPNKGSSGTLGSGGTNSNEYAQEYFDSDSDKEDVKQSQRENQPQTGIVKKNLSQIDEERTEMMRDDQTLADQTPVSPMKGTQATNFSKALKSVGMSSPGQRIGTAGCDRTQTEYITTESAMKSYIQKNLMIKDFRTRKPQSASNVEALAHTSLSPMSLGGFAEGKNSFDRSNSDGQAVAAASEPKKRNSVASAMQPTDSARRQAEDLADDPVEEGENSKHLQSGLAVTRVPGPVERTGTGGSDGQSESSSVKGGVPRGRLGSSKFSAVKESILEEKTEHQAEGEEAHEAKDEDGSAEAVAGEVGRNSSSEEFDDEPTRDIQVPAGPPLGRG